MREILPAPRRRSRRTDPSVARGASSSREAQRGLTRKQITNAARACFYDRGVAETSAEQIALAAGVSRATLYQHFPNKDAILLELLSANLRAVRGLYRDLRDCEVLDLASVRSWLSDYLRILREHRQAMRLFHVGLANDGPARVLIDDHRDAIVVLLAERFPVLARNHPDHARNHARAVLVLARVDHVASAGAEDQPRIDVEAGFDLVAVELAGLLTLPSPEG